MERIRRGHFAVFTRNHRQHLDEAVELCAADRTRRVTFRAANRWTSAERSVSPSSPVPIYIAVVGGSGTVEYVADLCDVKTHPFRGDPKTEELLGVTTTSTKDEGLWEQYERKVKTLYCVMRCRKLARPFPLSQLKKADGGQPLSADYHYSYALVMPAEID